MFILSRRTPHVPMATRKRLWHVVASMAKARKSAPAASPEVDPLAKAVDRLTAELRMLRNVMDEIREDFSWVTRNGLPIQPIEHVHVKRMALDPCAEDWGDHLEIERSTYVPRGSASPLDSTALDRIAEELTTSFESVAQGQLEIVLTALDGVRTEILNALKRRRGDPANGEARLPKEPAKPATVAVSATASINEPPTPDTPKPPPGQLF